MCIRASQNGAALAIQGAQVGSRQYGGTRKSLDFPAVGHHNALRRQRGGFIGSEMDAHPAYTELLRAMPH